MEPTKELIDQLDRENIEDARRMTIALKLAAGGELFDDACQVVLWGIKARYPGISDEEALEKLRRRIDFASQTETRV